MQVAGSRLAGGDIGRSLVRAALLAGVAVGTTACANEPLNGGRARFAPLMMLNGRAMAGEAPSTEAPVADELGRKSLAAKVLASRALETVTGLKTDPARLSEHD